MSVDRAVLDWLQANHDRRVDDLAALVKIPSVSTDGEHQGEIDRTAALTCGQMRAAGLQNVAVLKTGGSNPYAYGEWLGAPGKPTVFLYAHHDVQPVHQQDLDERKWRSDPWTLTRRDGRLYARGAADDKGAVVAQLGAVAAYLKTKGSLPVNVKMLVEGEEEVGSSNLLDFFDEHKDRIRSDVIVVCDTENVETGWPSITYSLRGIVAALVEAKAADLPVHSGVAGGALADAAIALNVILSRLYWADGPLPIPHYYDRLRPLSDRERKAMAALAPAEPKLRAACGTAPGVRFANEKGVGLYEQTWRRPAITVIAQEASAIKTASNQVLPTARALVSCRIVPDQDPDEVLAQLKALLTADPPWGVRVTVKPEGAVKWWMTDPTGPAFEAAVAAMRAVSGKEPALIGSGGTIGFVGPLAELFGGAPALLLGIDDPKSAAHAPNESLHEGDWANLMRSLAHLFANLGALPGGKVK
jgi:acetylornithine deacetylase/succinyl-diaminopimelate desuccinylase-like protein